MPTPAIIKGSDNFFTNIYTGNGGGQRVGKFQPFTDNGTIAKSVIYNRGDTPKLSKTPSSNGNKRTYTISFWYKPTDLATRRVVFSSDTSGSDYFYWEFDASNKIDLAQYSGPALRLQTNREFFDTSKFYHFLLAVDTTQSTASNRLKLYVDGDQITSFAVETYPSQDLETKVNSTSYPMAVGSFNSLTSLCTGGYLAEYNFVDGTALTPSTFGLTDTSTGRWIPKALTGITYGTNGFRMEFANSAGQTIGDDTSGNGNDYTVSGLAATDINTDTPTQNFMTFFTQDASAGTLSEGNLLLDPHTGSGYRTRGTPKTIPQSGKWYMEVKLNVSSGTAWRNHSYGVLDLNLKQIQDLGTSSQFDLQAGGTGIYLSSDRVHFTSILGTSYEWRTDVGSPHVKENGDLILMAFDMDDGKAWWGTRDTSAGTTYWFNNSGGTTGNPSTGVNPTITFTPKDHRFMVCQGFYPDSGATLQWYFGSQGFNLTAPTGYGKLSQENFPDTGEGIPDFTWIKERSDTSNHQIYDSNRGAGELLMSSSSNAETTRTDALYKFLKGGYAVGDNSSINGSGDDVVAWNWVANGGTTTANTDGSGASLASTVQANPTAGFSIVTYAGSSSGAKTVAHGLSQIPEMIWIKNRTDNSRNWFVYHINASYASMVPYDGNAAYYLNLNTSDARGSGNVFNNTAPTNKVFHIQDAGSLNTNGSGKNYVAYCFHSVHGFSQIGKYLGNGSADGTFVYTGFKPAWLMVKCLSPSGTNWIVWDNTRSKFNPRDNVLYPDLTQAETASGNDMDFYANGFKARGTNGNYNTSSRNYTYMAFAEHPLEGNGTNSATAL